MHVTTPMPCKGSKLLPPLCSSLDANGKRVAKKTLPEMEKEFLTALNAWYFEGGWPRAAHHTEHALAPTPHTHAPSCMTLQHCGN